MPQPPIIVIGLDSSLLKIDSKTSGVKMMCLSSVWHLLIKRTIWQLFGLSSLDLSINNNTLLVHIKLFKSKFSIFNLSLQSNKYTTSFKPERNLEYLS